MKIHILTAILFCILSVSSGSTEPTPVQEKTYQDSRGREWKEVSDGTWKESQGLWSRIWTVQKNYPGFIVLIDSSHGIILALPIDGGRGYMSHQSNGIWFPYPSTFKAIVK